METPKVHQRLERIEQLLIRMLHAQCPECHGARVRWRVAGREIGTGATMYQGGQACRHPLHETIDGS